MQLVAVYYYIPYVLISFLQFVYFRCVSICISTRSKDFFVYFSLNTWQQFPLTRFPANKKIIILSYRYIYFQSYNSSRRQYSKFSAIIPNVLLGKYLVVYKTSKRGKKKQLVIPLHIVHQFLHYLMELDINTDQYILYKVTIISLFLYEALLHILYVRINQISEFVSKPREEERGYQRNQHFITADYTFSTLPQ